MKEKVNVLADMDYSLHNIDVAADFVKLNGIQLIMTDLNATDEILRAAVAISLVTAMQNNQKV